MADDYLREINILKQQIEELKKIPPQERPQKP